MKYSIVDRLPRSSTSKSEAFLIEDRWDDWGKYRTQFALVYFDEEGERHDIGSVKIGEVGLAASRTVQPGQRAPTLDRTFTTLTERHFSLGQDDTYYEALSRLSGGIGGRILGALRDVAHNLDIYELHRSEDVMGESLMRFVSDANIRGKFHRLAHGDLKLSAFDFHFAYASQDSEDDGPILAFRVKPYELPPTNVHVIIGRNGVGKTRLLQGIARALLESDQDDGAVGSLTMNPEDLEDWTFSGLVYVSFSAFDDFKLPSPETAVIRAAQVSLTGGGSVDRKDGRPTKAGAGIFSASLAKCRRGPRRQRWLDAVANLESDPLFKEAQVTDLADPDDQDWKKRAEDLFATLSSGHAVVLLTITRLVELVDEKTLVLIDEPEGHLHPPLLSALIRSLSDLLTKRNGVALIATHSPVVLQEVPRSCVWRLRRSWRSAVAERPSIETFGGNIGVLTNEVFGLEVTSSGFHTLLDAQIQTRPNYETVLAAFRGQLGSDAKAIVRGLTAAAETPDDGS